MGSHPSKNGDHSDSSSTVATSAESQGDGVFDTVNKGTLQEEGVPIPEAPSTTKHDVLQKYDFTAIDRVAVNAPPELLLKSISDVVEYLIVTPEGEVLDDISKVRALFRWITSFDVYRIDTEVIPPEDSPLEYFIKIQCDFGDHAHMFYLLCQMADIPCVIINGMTKNASYEIGGPLVRDAMASQWNAVYVQGEWRLIDIFWAVACTEAKTTTDYILVNSNREVSHVLKNGVPEYPVNEFYFLCDPGHLIWTHFPDEVDWQLLIEPRSVKAYESQIYVREQYCNLGMSIAEDYVIDSCTLKSNGETIKLAFNIPPDKSKNIKFHYALYQHRTQVETEKRVDIILERFVRLEHTNNEVRLKLRFPITGKFIFDLFAADMKSSGRFELICSYLVITTNVTSNHMPFPDTPTLGWGPNPYAECAGLVLIEPKTTILETDTGICQVCVGIQGIKTINNVLKHTLIDDAVLSKHTVARFEEDRYIINLRLPEEGEYALKIYAKTKLNIPNSITELITFLVKFKNAITKGQANLPFPNVSGGLLGAKPGASNLKIQPLTYKTNFVDLPEGQASFVFKSRENVRLVCEASSVLREASSRMSVKCKVENERYVFEIDFPIASEYSLNVFGIEDSDPATLHEIHSYLVQSAGRPIKVHFMDDEGVEENISQGIKTSDGSIEIAIPEPMVGDILYSIIQRRDAKEAVNGCKASVTTSKARMMVNIMDSGEYLMDVYERDDESNFLKIACFTISKNPTLKTYHTDIMSILKMLKPQHTGGKGRKSITDYNKTQPKLKKIDHSSKSQTKTPRKKEQNRASKENHALCTEEDTTDDVRVDEEKKQKEDHEDENEKEKTHEVNGTHNEVEKDIQVNSSRAAVTTTSMTTVAMDPGKDQQKKDVEETNVKDSNEQTSDNRKIKDDESEERKQIDHPIVDEKATEERDNHQKTMNNKSEEELTSLGHDNEKLLTARQVVATAVTKGKGKRKYHTATTSVHEEMHSKSSSSTEIPTTGFIKEPFSDSKSAKHKTKSENKENNIDLSTNEKHITPRKKDFKHDNTDKTTKTKSNDKHDKRESYEKIKTTRKDKSTVPVVGGAATMTNNRKKYKKKKQDDVTKIRHQNVEKDNDQETSTDEENSLDGKHQITASVLTATGASDKEKQKHNEDHKASQNNSKTNHFSNDENTANSKVNAILSEKERNEKNEWEKSKRLPTKNNNARESTHVCAKTDASKKLESLSKAVETETKSGLNHVKAVEKNEFSDKEERKDVEYSLTKVVPPLDLQRGSDDSNYSDNEDEILVDSERHRQVTARKESVTRAIKNKSLKDLVTHLRELKNMEYCEDEDFIAEATRMVEMLKAKENLTMACNTKELAVLEKAIKKAKRINYKNTLDVQIILASRILKRLKRTEQLSKTVLEMNQKALVELKMYQTPPKGVHETLMATFLLLGEETHDMKTWPSCKSILFKTGPQYIMRRISNFNPKIVAKETANSSKQLIAPLTLLQICDVSKGAASFYKWTKGMLEEVENKSIVGPNAGRITVSRRQIPPRSVAPIYYDNIVRDGTIVMRL